MEYFSYKVHLLTPFVEYIFSKKKKSYSQFSKEMFNENYSHGLLWFLWQYMGWQNQTFDFKVNNTINLCQLSYT